MILDSFFLGDWGVPTPLEKTTFQKPNLIRFKVKFGACANPNM